MKERTTPSIELKANIVHPMFSDMVLMMLPGHRHISHSNSDIYLLLSEQYLDQENYTSTQKEQITF
jgi:hypothetical protein